MRASARGFLAFAVVLAYHIHGPTLAGVGAHDKLRERGDLRDRSKIKDQNERREMTVEIAASAFGLIAMTMVAHVCRVFVTGGRVGSVPGLLRSRLVGRDELGMGVCRCFCSEVAGCKQLLWGENVSLGSFSGGFGGRSKEFCFDVPYCCHIRVVLASLFLSGNSKFERMRCLLRPRRQAFLAVILTGRESLGDDEGKACDSGRICVSCAEPCEWPTSDISQGC